MKAHGYLVSLAGTGGNVTHQEVALSNPWGYGDAGAIADDVAVSLGLPTGSVVITSVFYMGFIEVPS